MDNARITQLINDCFHQLTDNEVLLPSEGVTVPVLEAPLVGLASAGDPIWETFKSSEVIGPEFKAPREFMPGAKTVVALFFPFTEEIYSRHAASTAPTDEAWTKGYAKKDSLVNELTDALISALEKEGVRSVVPTRDPSFARNVTPTLHDGVLDMHYSVSWSNRHICYAAGLGTFGIHRHIITDKGCFGTLASIIVDCELEPTQRNYTGPYDYCTKCGACVKRCPVNAISVEHLRNLKACSENGAKMRENYGSWCGKCLVGIPCDRKRP